MGIDSKTTKERKATQADAGWRAKEQPPRRKTTQADTGWRAVGGLLEKIATQVDAGRRVKEQPPRRKATQADAGWRANEQSPRRKVAQADAGRRVSEQSPRRKVAQTDAGRRVNEQPPKRKVTQADTGWRASEQPPKRKVTQADTGWRASEQPPKRKVAQADTSWQENEQLSVRNATQADTGWREPEQPVEQKSLQADTGWQENEQLSVRKVTQADKGWREPEQPVEQKSLQADMGWQENEQLPVRKVTQADTGWREPEQPVEQKVTQADTGWREPEQPVEQKVTQADTGWREPEQPVEQKSLQADIGWQENEQLSVRKVTQADTGWREPEQPVERKVTQADTGWREPEQPIERKVTQADTGWREPEQPVERKATQADTGWREPEQLAVRKVTQVDEGWRSSAAEMLDPTNVMNRATANAFADIEDFQEAVSRLPELVSSINNRYMVKNVLSCAGGESIILLCSAPDGRDVVAKVYFEPVNSAGSSIPARTRVLDFMGTEEGKKYTLAVIEIGLVEFGESRYYFEIMPYCSEGDLTHEGAFSFDDIVKLTQHLNEALHSMHEAGILHRDIKPENLYRLNGNVVIGDFGVAKLTKAGVTRHTAGTDCYRAPESVLAVSAGESAFFFDEKCDYYSLGVTLGSLFEGRFVYEGMDAGMITVAVRNGRLPLRRIDPNREQLENLLDGLCRYDSRYRFGYEDVNKWLTDHNYTGGILDEEWPKAFRMLNEEYRDEKSLFYGITKDAEHWNEGVNMLYSKFFENFFVSFRTDLARSAQIADELYRGSDRDKGLSVFLKNLFAPGPIVWKGYTFTGLSELGNKMVATKTPAAYGEILRKGCVSHWLDNTEGIETDENVKELVNDIEKLSNSEPEIACYWFGNSFAEDKKLEICGKNVSSLKDLFHALLGGPKRFYQDGGLQKLLNRKEGADLYGFLFSFGYKELIDQEWSRLENCDTFNKACILFSMLDSIAVQSNNNPDIIRKFFVNYGPIGAAVYTQNILARMQKGVYIPLDVDGKAILSSISKFRANTTDSVEMIFREHIPLIESVEKLRKMLIDNPFCIVTGVYESKGVICTNLMGCFAFKLYDRFAPLGFQTFIQNGNGGN